MSGHLITPGDARRLSAREHALNKKASIGEVMAMLENGIGPVCVTLQELMLKVARLEDHAGITDESVAGEAAPVGTPYVGSSDSGEIVFGIDRASREAIDPGMADDVHVVHATLVDAGGDTE